MHDSMQYQWQVIMTSNHSILILPQNVHAYNLTKRESHRHWLLITSPMTMDYKEIGVDKTLTYYELNRKCVFNNAW